MYSKPSGLLLATMTLTVLAVEIQSVSAQLGPTLQIGGGALTAFGHAGPFGQLTALPFVAVSGASVEVTVGATAWYSHNPTSYSPHRTRNVLGMGPAVELTLRQPANPFQVSLLMSAEWLRSEVPDVLSTGQGPLPPITDRIGVAHGVGIGAEGTVGYALTESTGIRAGIGHMYHAIYPERSGGFWKFGMGLVLGL